MILEGYISYSLRCRRTFVSEPPDETDYSKVNILNFKPDINFSYSSSFPVPLDTYYHNTNYKSVFHYQNDHLNIDNVAQLQRQAKDLDQVSKRFS